LGSTLNFVFGDLLIIAFCKEEGSPSALW